MKACFNLRQRLGVLVSCGIVVLGTQWGWTQGKSATPATIEEARKIIDLNTVPVFKGAKNLKQRSLFILEYEVAGSAKDVYEFHRKGLVQNKWKEGTKKADLEEWILCPFKRDGYLLMVSVDSTRGETSVSLQNHGNIDFNKLSLPPGAEASILDDPLDATFYTRGTKPATLKTMLKMFKDKGWQLYGTHGDEYNQHFKQNAMRVTMSIGREEDAGAKTVISLHADLMPFDVPVPPDAFDVDYTDANGIFYLDTKLKPAAVADFYIKGLAKGGWKPKTDSLTEVDSKQVMVFQNPQQDTLTMEITSEESKSHVEFVHQSAQLRDQKKPDPDTKKK